MGRSEFSLRLITVNVQCLTNKLQSLEVFCAAGNPGTLCIQEHWCSSDHIAVVHLPGYACVTDFCRAGGEQGGTSIFMSKQLNLSYEVVDCLRFSEKVNFECYAIKFIIEKRG